MERQSERHLPVLTSEGLLLPLHPRDRPLRLEIRNVERAPAGERAREPPRQAGNPFGNRPEPLHRQAQRLGLDLEPVVGIPVETVEAGRPGAQHS